jgi:histidinol-phosphate aminotransferase
MGVLDLARPAIRALAPYVADDVAEGERERAIEGGGALYLGFNENPLGASPKAVEAMRRAAGSASWYPAPFCEALREKIGRFHGFARDPASHVVATSGASGAIALICDAFVEPGDEAVSCEPTFGAHAGHARRLGGAPVALPLAGGLRFDLAAIRGAVNARTKLVYVCNPNNPTGTVVDAGELREFVRGMPAHVVTVVDEAYVDFADDPARESVVPEIRDDGNLIVLRTFSKAYGLAGARVGYALMGREMHGVLQRAQGVFSVSRIAAAGAAAALDDAGFLERARACVAAGRRQLAEGLEAMGARCAPSQANFVYADTGRDPAALSAACLARGLVIPGFFEWTRITVGTPEQNARALAILRDAIASGEVPKKAGG